MKYFYMIYAAAIVIMSLVAFVLYYADKVKAKKGAWRIKEAVLLGCGFFCGAIGALLGILRGTEGIEERWIYPDKLEDAGFLPLE